MEQQYTAKEYQDAERRLSHLKGTIEGYCNNILYGSENLPLPEEDPYTLNVITSVLFLFYSDEEAQEILYDLKEHSCK